MQKSTDASTTAVAATTHHLPTARPARRYRALKTTVLGIGLAVSAACGGHGSRVTLPSTTPPAAPSAGSSSSGALVSPHTRDVVVAAYAAFLDAAKKAILAPSQQARRILQGYATGAYLDFQVRQVNAHQAAHEEPWGKAVIHVTKVDIAGSTATIHDCQDASHVGLADARTHQVIPQSRGTANENLVANMTLGSDGRWRVAGIKMYRAACHAS